MKKPPHEQFVCWVCDYGLAGLALIILSGVGFLVRGLPGHEVVQIPRTPPPVSQLTEEVVAELLPTRPLPQPISLEITPSSMPTVVSVATISAPTQMPAPTLTTPAPPTYILVFIPVNWSGSQEEFRTTAAEHARYFMNETGMGQFFHIETVFLEQGMDNADLGSYTLLLAIHDFGLEHSPGDRYIGITDGDLAPEGKEWVAGFSMGPGTQPIVSEAQPATITAHELGHTYGLCDEYRYEFWQEQNAEYAGGCPNPYPETCQRGTNRVDECQGSPTEDGRFSIMAGSGPPELSGFNRYCLEHFKKVYRTLSGEEQQ